MVMHLVLATDEFLFVLVRTQILRLRCMSLRMFVGATVMWHLRPPILCGTLIPTSVLARFCDVCSKYVCLVISAVCGFLVR